VRRTPTYFYRYDISAPNLNFFEMFDIPAPDHRFFFDRYLRRRKKCLPKKIGSSALLEVHIKKIPWFRRTNFINSQKRVGFGAEMSHRKKKF